MTMLTREGLPRCQCLASSESRYQCPRKATEEDMFCDFCRDSDNCRRSRKFFGQDCPHERGETSWRNSRESGGPR